MYDVMYRIYVPKWGSYLGGVWCLVVLDSFIMVWYMFGERAAILLNICSNWRFARRLPMYVRVLIEKERVRMVSTIFDYFGDLETSKMDVDRKMFLMDVECE